MKTPIRQLIEVIRDCESYSELIYHIDKNYDLLIEAEKQMVIEAVKFGNAQPLMASGKMLGESYYTQITEG